MLTAVDGRDGSTPVDLLEYASCFAEPLRLTQSTWVQHVPFGMFLVEALSPRTVVELGTYRGVSYCAFCQTIERLGLAANCYAVDTWAGDHQSGYFGDDVLTDLRAHHDARYGGFSRLLRSDFDSACEHFSNRSIDLLHIDGLHTYEAVRHDFETWLPKMTDRGVILLHDTNVREGDFGVWRFWEEVRSRYPHFEMLHGYGLGVLAVGSEQPGPVKFLTGAGVERTAGIRQFFYHLGSRLESLREVAEMRGQLDVQGTRLMRLEARHRTLTRIESSPVGRVCSVWAEHGIGGTMRRVLGRIRSQA